MKRKDYWPNNDADRVLLLQNLVTKLPNYLVALGITGAEQSFLNLAAGVAQSVCMYQDQSKPPAEIFASHPAP